MTKYIDDLINFKFVSNWAEAANDNILKEYMERRGLNKKTIVDFEIGYDVETDRFTIPIKDIDDNIVNIRKYKLNPGNNEPKIMSYAKGFGEMRLFPIKNAFKEDQNIIICEGEHDAILLNQEGFNTVTSTTGAFSWSKEWNEYFRKKTVYIIFDCDKVGREAAITISEHLSGHASEIYIIDLQLKDKEDVTDFFVQYKKTKVDLCNIFSKTEPIDSYLATNLVDAINAENCGKKLKFPGIVVGKDLSPYQVPLRVRMQCKNKEKKKKACPLCSFFATEVEDKEEKSLIFDYHKEILINMAGKPNTQKMGMLRKIFKVPAFKDCNDLEIEILSLQNLEDINIVPEISYKENESKYALRRAFYFGANIQTNQSYLFKGTTLPDPNNQMGLYAIKEVKGTKDIISKFELTDKHRKDLEIFKPEEPTKYSIDKKIKEICEDLSVNVTKIIKRDDLIIAMNLVYHSVLNFYFYNEYIKKGWLELSIVGDTGIGKTETIKELTHHFRAGEFITSGENATKAGLIGGLQQVNNTRWTVTWGKLVLNDRGACTIDEMDDLSRNNLISAFSGIRSSGIAELIKVQTQKTTARTRIIWIANPLNNGKMASYNYGIEAIQELFKDQQDIRRIDFAIACTKEQVPFEEINMERNRKIEHVYNTEIYHTSVMRAWNIKKENVIFENGSEGKILNLAIRFGKKYSSDIPLVLGSDIRIKIARLCIALATWLYSTYSGDEVIVYPCHVDYIEMFLESIYDTDTLGYNAYSNHRRRRLQLKNIDDLNNLVSDIDRIDELLNNKIFAIGDLEEIFCCTDRQEARLRVSNLRKCGAIYKNNQYYQKTPAFINFLIKKRKAFENRDVVQISF